VVKGAITSNLDSETKKSYFYFINIIVPVLQVFATSQQLRARFTETLCTFIFDTNINRNSKRK